MPHDALYRRGEQVLFLEICHTRVPLIDIAFQFVPLGFEVGIEAKRLVIRLRGARRGGGSGDGNGAGLRTGREVHPRVPRYERQKGLVADRESAICG
jgi:hypothetical protein